MRDLQRHGIKIIIGRKLRRLDIITLLAERPANDRGRRIETLYVLSRHISRISQRAQTIGRQQLGAGQWNEVGGKERHIGRHFAIIFHPLERKVDARPI